MVSAKYELVLKQLTFSAAVDFVTITADRSTKDINLNRRIKWSEGSTPRQLTVHEPDHRDVLVLARQFPKAAITRIQMSVRIALESLNPSDSSSIALLRRTHTSIANHFCPYGALLVGEKKTFIESPGIAKPQPFALRDLNPNEVVLYGLPDDLAHLRIGCRAIEKQGYGGRSVSCVYMAVNIMRPACSEIGLMTPIDLHGFGFRKLRPLFRLARVPIPVMHRNLTKGRFSREWASSHAPANKRIKDALHRLQRAFSIESVVVQDPAFRAAMPDIHKAVMADRITTKTKFRFPGSGGSPEVVIRL